MDALTARLRRDFPDLYPPNGGLTFSVVPLREQVVGSARRSVWHADGGGGLRAADRLRQRRQPAAVARRRRGSARSPSARRSAPSRAPHRAAAAHRERAARVRRRRASGWCSPTRGLHWMQLLGTDERAAAARDRDRRAACCSTRSASRSLSALVFGLAPALRAARVDLQAHLKDGHGALGRPRAVGTAAAHAQGARRRRADARR